MFKYLFCVIFSLTFYTGYSQIEISDKTEKLKSNTIEYKGEFAQLGYSLTLEEKQGLIGNDVTLIDVFYYDIKKEDGSKVSFKDKELFVNKTFEIIDYQYDLKDILTLKNDSGTFLYSPSQTDTYIFNKFLDYIKEKYLGMEILSLKRDQKLKDISSNELVVKSNKPYKVTNVEFSNLQDGYGIVFTLDNEIKFVYPTDDLFQTDQKGFLILTDDNKYFPTKVLFIEYLEFEKFKKENVGFVEAIRKGNVKIGMTEKQTKLSWGSPSTSFSNIAGYDKVNQYGSVQNSQNLYFKNDKLKLIK